MRRTNLAIYRKMFRYFYLNGKLHKLLEVVRTRDEAYAWCYSEHKLRLYQWSDVRKHASKGYTIGQVSKMVGRSSRMIGKYIEYGLVEKPELTYSLQTGNTGILIFSEEMVLKVQEAIAGTHFGRPRNDGIVKPLPHTSKQEIYAQMKHDMTLYAKNKDGEFVPLYMAEEW